MRIIILLLFPVVVFLLPSHAQQTDTTRKSVKVMVIDPNGKKKVEYKGKPIRTDSVPHALKVAPLLLFRGELSVFFEKRISDAFSFEVGFGVTYIDLMYETIQNEGRFLFNGTERNAVRFFSGYSLRGQFRWYPSAYETAIAGYYFAPDIALRSWRMEYNVFNGLVKEPHDIIRQWTDIKLTFGYQDAYPYEDFFTDWYVSAGIRYTNEDYVSGSGIQAVFLSRAEVLPVVNFGVKISYNY
ncbi:MAG: hypothetical protein Fur0041_11170 [Bacteroidia bacterium]